jgi:hypothetical protein
VALQYNFDAAAVEKIDAVVNTKGTPIIYKQNPPAGTPIAQGMQVTVQTVQPKDIKAGDVVQNIPIQVANVSLEDLIELWSDPFFQSLGDAPSVPDTQKQQFVTEINQKLSDKGLQGTVTLNDVDTVFGAIQGTSQIGINRKTFNTGAFTQFTAGSNIGANVGSNVGANIGLSGGFVAGGG